MGRTDQLADQFIATHREFYDFVKTATPEQWRAKGINHPEIKVGDEDEGRPVGLIAHHVGNGYRNGRSRCQAWIGGEDPPPPTGEVNKRHAAENPDPDQRETLRFLEEQSTEMEAFIRGLNDRELAATGTFVTGPTTVEEFVGRTQPFHIRWHMGSIRATWEQLAARQPDSSD
jgi:DinB superfamily